MMEIKERVQQPIVRSRTDCRMCRSENLHRVWSFGHTPLANSYLKPEQVGQQEEVVAPLDVYYCADCHLVQLKEIVSPHLLFDEYLYVSSTSPKFVQHFTEYAQHLAGRFGLQGDALVVDVGSNDGVLLKPLQRFGIKILGIDPAINIAEKANAEGVPTLAEYFTVAVAQRVARKLGRARVIAANNVFAHTDDVDEFTRAVKELLADEGVFVFEAQYLGDLLANNLFDIVYHEHVCYYAIHPLIKFFQKHQLEIFDVQRLPVHGGSIRVFVQRAGGRWPRSQAVDDILQEEEDEGLLTLAPYQSFAERVASNKAKLQGLLGQIKAEGGRIAGYGAPAKATTLMHVLGIDGTTLDFIIDDSRYKQGLVMPGTHVPIVPPEKIYNSNIDYCLVLAWNFADAIMEKHKRFAESGGRFIVPVPVPRIVTSNQ